MAVLTFETPRGEYCNWDDGRCPMYDGHSFHCEFFGAFLHQDGKAFLKCDECAQLGKNGTSKKLKR